MAAEGIKVNMTPSHPGEFIRTEIIEELGLTHHSGRGSSGRKTGDAVGIAKLQIRAVARNGTANREGVWCEHGRAAAYASVA